MRLKIAVPLLLVGLVLMIIGIGQRTFWAPPTTATAVVEAGGQESAVTVIDAELRPGGQDMVDVNIKGDGDFIVAMGRADDVDAWVGGAAHNTLSGVRDGKITAVYTEGGKTVPDPRGSDLWVSQEAATGEITSAWVDPAPGEWSLLVAADGKQAAPTDISVSWPSDASSPWAIPLTIIGALLAILGLVLCLTSKSHGSKRRGKRTPAPGSRAAARTARKGGSRALPVKSALSVNLRLPVKYVLSVKSALSIVIALPLVLSGPLAASAQGQPASKPAAPPHEATPALLESQLKSILDAVATTDTEADAARDPKLLKDRVAGGAEQLRSAGYRVRAKAPDVEALPAVAVGPVLTRMITTSRNWPRTVVAVTQGKSNVVPQALVLS